MSILRDEPPVGVVMKMRDLEGNIFRFTQRCATSERKWRSRRLWLWQRIAVSAVAVCCLPVCPTL